MKSLVLGLAVCFCALCRSQTKDTLVKRTFWPTEKELKSWLAQQFPSRDIAVSHKDSSFGFYTFVESFEMTPQRNISLQQGKKYWNRVDAQLKRDSIAIKLWKSGVQSYPDANTPNPEVLTYEHLTKQAQKRSQKGKDATLFLRQIEALEESQNVFWDRFVLWMTTPKE